jgi:flagellum-specific peptidoglycan hydrolase FlgJ
MATAEEINAFIKEIAPLIQAEAKKRGYKVASPIIAQACIESAFGTSSLGYKYHNYFGMKCGSSWNGKSVNLKTKEEYKVGVLTTIKDNFRVFDSMADGVAGYFDFINTKRYANLKDARTAKEYLETIKADGYATSSTYVNTNMKCIEKYGLYRFDDFGESVSRPITPKLISDVIDGKYGDGNSRTIALARAGYNAVEVQQRINDLYKIAQEVKKYKDKTGDYFECVLKFL